MSAHFSAGVYARPPTTSNATSPASTPSFFSLVLFAPTLLTFALDSVQHHHEPRLRAGCMVAHAGRTRFGLAEDSHERMDPHSAHRLDLALPRCPRGCRRSPMDLVARALQGER